MINLRNCSVLLEKIGMLRIVLAEGPSMNLKYLNRQIKSNLSLQQETNINSKALLPITNTTELH